MLVRYPCSAGVLQRFSGAWFWQYLGDFWPGSFLVVTGVSEYFSGF